MFANRYFRTRQSPFRRLPAYRPDCNSASVAQRDEQKGARVTDERNSESDSERERIKVMSVAADDDDGEAVLTFSVNCPAVSLALSGARINLFSLTALVREMRNGSGGEKSGEKN